MGGWSRPAAGAGTMHKYTSASEGQRVVHEQRREVALDLFGLLSHEARGCNLG